MKHLPLGLLLGTVVAGAMVVTSPPSASVDAITAKAVAAAHGADVGFAVFDRQSGRPVLEHNAGLRSSTASLVKLLIAVDLLVQRNGRLDQTESTQVHTMLSASDDDIAHTLWDQDGGPDIVTRAASLMGLTNTFPPADPEQWGDTTTTASDIAMVYRYLLDRAPATYRHMVMQALRDSTPLGTDGFNQRFGIPSAVGNRRWAVKQGWSCCTQPSPLPDGVVLHTTGTVGPRDRYIVVVLTDHKPSTTWSTAAERTTDIVRALLPLMPG
jgi:D-alanyl-D-alanine carboxypeptidase